MELKSVKKKFKDKKFAAGCSRDVIAKGAELLGWELDELLAGAASKTALPFFLGRGYAIEREQQVPCRGQVLTNYALEKIL